MKFLRCPGCGKVNEAFDIQIAGKESIVCPSCGWHGYSNRTPLIIRNLPVININKYLVRRRFRY